MPYIKTERRKELQWVGVRDFAITTPGELNYAFTLILTEYIKDKQLSYQTINDIIGALEGAKLEFYRRIAVPYEDTKIKENGDVY